MYCCSWDSVVGLVGCFLLRWSGGGGDASQALEILQPVYGYNTKYRNCFSVSHEAFLWFYCISTIVGYVIPNPFLYIQTVLFQTIHFSVSTLFSSIWATDRTLSSALTPSQSGRGIDVNEGVLCILQNSMITEASQLYRLVSYPRHSMGESYPSAEK